MNSDNPSKNNDALLPVDASARRLARTLLRTARFASLGTLEADGSPSVSRVTIATLIDGAPGFLISRLSGHFGNLENDSRCSLLVGEVGKGDPLAHARMTLIGRAHRLEGDLRQEFARRFLLRHPKAELYAGFADFAFWTFVISRASLNGGFGRAFSLTPEEVLISDKNALQELANIEPGAVAHMNAQHAEAVDKYARLAGGAGDGWKLASLDAEGLDLVRGDLCLRLWFDAPLASASDLRPKLVKIAQQVV